MADNPVLEPDEEYTFFVRAAENDDIFVTSDYYEPVRTQPSEGGKQANVSFDNTII